jgi:hypothetical protein
MRDLLSTGEVARECGVPPRLISDLFWTGKLDERRCRTVGGRRAIPVDYVSEIREILQRLGKLPELAKAVG